MTEGVAFAPLSSPLCCSGWGLGEHGQGGCPTSGRPAELSDLPSGKGAERALPPLLGLERRGSESGVQCERVLRWSSCGQLKISLTGNERAGTQSGVREGVSVCPRE